MQLKPALPSSPRTKTFLIAFLVCSLLVTGFCLTRAKIYRVTFEVATDSRSTAQLFFNTGRGFNETESGTAIIDGGSLSAFQAITFNLPSNSIELRFDPMTTEGKTAIRKIFISGPDGFNIDIPFASVQPFNQIKDRVEIGKEVDFTTTAGANDPGLKVAVPFPLEKRRARLLRKLYSIVEANAALLFVFLLLYFLGDAFVFLRGKLAETANRLSDSSFLRLDANAILFYLFCLCCFFVAIAADLNGSSSEVLSRVYGYGFEKAPLVGTAKEIRSDEFSYHTPDILNQVFRPDHFAVNPSPLGDHSIALTGNVPIRHYSTIFRPQFWSFFVLPIDYAFSVYWQCKALLLVGGLFTLLLLLTGSTFWSATGALWYFFSPLTQWDYSWASLLPEMIGLICIVVVLLCFITVGRKPLALLTAALAAGACAINFTLCAYLPHLIPLFWFGAFAFFSWCLAKRDKIFVKDALIWRAVAFVLAFAMPLIVGLFLLPELNQAIAAVGRTIYPGLREFSGGTLPIRAMLSYFLDWDKQAGHVPPVLANICEGSGFLLLAPATLFCLPRISFSRSQKTILIGLWTFFALMVLWSTVDLPVTIGKLFGLDRTAGARLVPALGLANVAIVVLTMAGLQEKLAGSLISISQRLLRAAGTIGVALSILLYDDCAYDHFFSKQGFLVSLAILSILLFFLFEGWKRAFALMLIVPNMLAFGTVNPVQRGLDVFTKSQFFTFVSQHPELRNGKWLIYSDSFVPSGFFAAAGCQTYTGLHYIPDIDNFSLFQAHGLATDVFNRDGILVARQLPIGTRMTAEAATPYMIRLSVSATDPVLTQLGIKYVAFDTKPSDAVAARLTSLAQGPIDKFWLYRVP